MKLFICALMVLALIASFCVFGAVACAAIIDEMVDLLDTAAPQGGVRAFEAFHGHHHALFDHDALADVKPAERFGDGPAVVDFRNLLG